MSLTESQICIITCSYFSPRQKKTDKVYINGLENVKAKQLPARDGSLLQTKYYSLTSLQLQSP